MIVLHVLSMLFETTFEGWEFEKYPLMTLSSFENRASL